MNFQEMSRFATESERFLNFHGSLQISAKVASENRPLYVFQRVSNADFSIILKKSAFLSVNLISLIFFADFLDAEPPGPHPREIEKNEIKI